MSLFRTIPTGGDFAPLFRLLDDYDVHRSGKSACASTARSFAPRFDVRETAEGYHLDGELPGIAQKDIDIEFSDPQTLVIKGRTERDYHTTDRDEAQVPTPAPSEGSESTKTEGSPDSKPDEKQPNKRKAKHHYWVSERSVGEFHRTFSFPTRVDQDGVKASLKNGILSLLVPKAAAPVAKKITIE
ncbi:30kD heat shock protein [Aspergillus ellipticus CBS 707.79]|uniref:30kD heat shock protein n=1 Tax=Aspergillus ellipticus CBS 707.79 TaxID=1448320 RepID=A0A319D632_9EURO|nr:30kD heat shock protein [Aspergillus ellipticus CBS 707.79]